MGSLLYPNQPGFIIGKQLQGTIDDICVGTVAPPTPTSGDSCQLMRMPTRAGGEHPFGRRTRPFHRTASRDASILRQGRQGACATSSNPNPVALPSSPGRIQRVPGRIQHVPSSEAPAHHVLSVLYIIVSV